MKSNLFCNRFSLILALSISSVSYLAVSDSAKATINYNAIHQRYGTKTTDEADHIFPLTRGRANEIPAALEAYRKAKQQSVMEQAQAIAKDQGLTFGGMSNKEKEALEAAHKRQLEEIYGQHAQALEQAKKKHQAEIAALGGMQKGLDQAVAEAQKKQDPQVMMAHIQDVIEHATSLKKNLAQVPEAVALADKALADAAARQQMVQGIVDDPKSKSDEDTIKLQVEVAQWRSQYITEDLKITKENLGAHLGADFALLSQADRDEAVKQAKTTVEELRKKKITAIETEFKKINRTSEKRYATLVEQDKALKKKINENQIILSKSELILKAQEKIDGLITNYKDLTDKIKNAGSLSNFSALSPYMDANKVLTMQEKKAAEAAFSKAQGDKVAYHAFLQTVAWEKLSVLLKNVSADMQNNVKEEIEKINKTIAGDAVVDGLEAHVKTLVEDVLAAAQKPSSVTPEMVQFAIKLYGTLKAMAPIPNKPTNPILLSSSQGIGGPPPLLGAGGLPTVTDNIEEFYARLANALSLKYKEFYFSGLDGQLLKKFMVLASITSNIQTDLQKKMPSALVTDMKDIQEKKLSKEKVYAYYLLFKNLLESEHESKLPPFNLKNNFHLIWSDDLDLVQKKLSIILNKMQELLKEHALSAAQQKKLDELLGLKPKATTSSPIKKGNALQATELFSAKRFKMVEGLWQEDPDLKHISGIFSTQGLNPLAEKAMETFFEKYFNISGWSAYSNSIKELDQDITEETIFLKMKSAIKDFLKTVKPTADIPFHPFDNNIKIKLLMLLSGELDKKIASLEALKENLSAGRIKNNAELKKELEKALTTDFSAALSSINAGEIVVAEIMQLNKNSQEEIFYHLDADTIKGVNARSKALFSDFQEAHKKIEEAFEAAKKAYAEGKTIFPPVYPILAKSSAIGIVTNTKIYKGPKSGLEAALQGVIPEVLQKLKAANSLEHGKIIRFIENSMHKDTAITEILYNIKKIFDDISVLSAASLMPVNSLFGDVHYDYIKTLYVLSLFAETSWDLTVVPKTAKNAATTTTTTTTNNPAGMQKGTAANKPKPTGGSAPEMSAHSTILDLLGGMKEFQNVDLKTKSLEEIEKIYEKYRAFYKNPANQGVGYDFAKYINDESAMKDLIFSKLDEKKLLLMFSDAKDWSKKHKIDLRHITPDDMKAIHEKVITIFKQATGKIAVSNHQDWKNIVLALDAHKKDWKQDITIAINDTIKSLPPSDTVMKTKLEKFRDLLLK